MTNRTHLLLAWENPPELFELNAVRAAVFRKAGVIADRLVNEDVSWGVYEDVENGDITAKYLVTYYDARGGIVAVVPNEDIARYNRPEGICKITFEMNSPIGAPERGKLIEVSDDLPGKTGSFFRRVLTNGAGKAVLFLKSHTHVLLRISGSPTALDVAVPDIREMTYEELVQHGTLVPTDPRQSIGGGL